MPDTATNNPTGKKLIRCAIYTRKSHEEGLEQEFNSLDAQREAAEAYIESQRLQGQARAAGPLRRRRLLRRQHGAPGDYSVCWPMWTRARWM